MNCYKTLNYHAFRAIIRQVANEVIVDSPGPVEVGHISRRHWNDLKEPTLHDLKVRVGKKKHKLRSKSLAAKKAAKKAQQTLPDTANPPEGSQEQAGASAPVAGLNPPGDNEVQVLAEVSGSNDQPRAGTGAAPRGPPQIPIIQTPQVFPLANPPSLGQGGPGVAQKRQYVDTPHYGRGFNKRVYGRNRGGGYGGRTKQYFPRGPRGGGNTNFGAPGLATNTSSRGNGGNSQGNYGGGPAFMAVKCWSCHQVNPSQNSVCSYCYSSLY